MRCYEVRLFSPDGAETLEVICADDAHAIERAARLAGGARFELWRGGRRLYAGG